MKKASFVLLGCLVLSACGGSTVKTVQSNENVRQVEQKVEQLVSRCLPTSNGAPDPVALRRSQARARFAACTGVVKRLATFQGCAVKVVLGRVPTVAGVEKGLTACVEQAA